MPFGGFNSLYCGSGDASTDREGGAFPRPVLVADLGNHPECGLGANPLGPLGCGWIQHTRTSRSTNGVPARLPEVAPSL